MVGVCSIEGCDRPHDSHGYCGTHARTWRKHGDPLYVRHKPTPIELISQRSVIMPNGCIQYDGAKDENGRAIITISAKQHRVYRVAWEAEHGAIAEGMTLDHMCGDGRCINTQHLRLATPVGNAQAKTVPGHGASQYRGVALGKKGRWRAYLTAYGKRYALGTYDTEVEAAEVARLGRLRLHELHAVSDVFEVG